MSEFVWRWPGLARKCHFFPLNEGVSLCGRWLMPGLGGGEIVLGDKPGPDDCVACWRKAKAAEEST